jgi:hypothetical protein
MSILNRTAAQLCTAPNIQLSFLMSAELAIVDAEDLKSRVRELRRFL